MQSLLLDDTAITDAGLLQLKAFPKLQSVKLGGGKITEAGIAQLQKLLPQVTIYRVPEDNP